jgi:hypothetical protein
MLTMSARSESNAPVPDVPLSFAVSAYPEALPNDGRSEAVITVVVSDASGVAVRGVGVRAQLEFSDGILREREVTTDREGRAQFHYRAGLSPRPARVVVSCLESGLQSKLEIPLAAVSYLDLLLVTPAEYEAHRRRQASAAPIYKLELSVFPVQLAADGGSTAHATATLTFTDGRTAPGVPLRAEVNGSDSRVTAAQQATDSTGRLSFYFTAGRTAGTATLRVIEPSTGLTTSVTILLVEAGPARVELLIADAGALSSSHDGTLMPADGHSELPLKIRVTDLYGSGLSGVEVRLEVLDMGSGWVELRDPVSDSFGEIEAVYHAGSATGPLRLRAYACAGLPEA